MTLHARLHPPPPHRLHPPLNPQSSSHGTYPQIFQPLLILQWLWKDQETWMQCHPLPFPFLTQATRPRSFHNRLLPTTLLHSTQDHHLPLVAALLSVVLFVSFLF